MGNENPRTVIAILSLVLLAAVPCDAAQHPEYPDFAQPSFFSLGNEYVTFGSPGGSASMDVAAGDFAVYKYGYVSYDGRQWERFELSGNALGGDWLNGSVSAHMSIDASDFGLTQSRISAGRNFVVVYSCSRTASGWDCHGGWQIIRFSAFISGSDAAVTGVSANSYESPNAPENTLDGVLSDTSRWAAEGDGEWIRYEISEPAVISYVRLAFYGDQVRYFDIQVSQDGSSWSNASAGLASEKDSPNTFQSFSFSPVSASYVRILGHGGSANDWISISEADIGGLPVGIGPACESHDSFSCYDGDVYWYDSCGAMEGVRYDCTETQSCAGGQCVDVPQLPSGIVSWWPLDGNAQDSVGGNHGTVSSALYASSDCKSGQCYLFDTNGDYITLAAPFTLSTGTYSFWISRGDISDDRIIMGNDPYSARIFLTTGGYVRMETDTNQQEFEFWSSQMQLDTLTHVALVRNGDSLSLYVNGAFVATTTVSGASPLTVSQIGMNGRSFRGSIDEVMVWDRALSASEVSQVYHYFDGPPPEPVCGNGITEPPDETCDGNCPASCSDGNPCTTDSMTGSAGQCNVECMHSQVTSCGADDGCCPSGCSEANDGDCAGEGVSLLHVSSNGRYLKRADGTPFLMAGDTAWSLIAQLSKTDADYYLQTRSDMGFNLILVNLIEHRLADNAPANYYGDQPFTGKVFTTPNEAYFAHADYVIGSAAEKGLYVLLDPLYIGWECGPDGWCSDIRASSENDMRAWGRYVGNRYKGYDNIIWLIGGDVNPPSDIKDRIRAYVAGIEEEDPNHLFTAHNVRGQMAIDPWPSEEWLTVNDVYTTDDALNANAKRAYDVSPAMPFFLLESYYEYEHGATLQELHEQAYAMVLSGGFGSIFGNCPLWSLGSTTVSAYCTLTDWKTQLHSTGSEDAIRAKNLLLSREWDALVPDFGHIVMTGGYGTLGQDDYATAALTSGGSTFIAYLPSQRAVTVNTGAISGGSIRSWWYNPRDGTYVDLGTATKVSTRTYTTPASSGPDWVLVVDDASAGYGPPGS